MRAVNVYICEMVRNLLQNNLISSSWAIYYVVLNHISIYKFNIAVSFNADLIISPLSIVNSFNAKIILSRLNIGDSFNTKIIFPPLLLRKINAPHRIWVRKVTRKAQTSDNFF